MGENRRRRIPSWLEPFHFTWRVVIGLFMMLYSFVLSFFGALEAKTIAVGFVGLASAAILSALAFHQEPEATKAFFVEKFLPGLALILLAIIFVFGCCSVLEHLRSRQKAPWLIETMSALVAAAGFALLIGGAVYAMQGALDAAGQSVTGRRTVSITIVRPGAMSTYTPEQLARSSAFGAAGIAFVAFLCFVATGHVKGSPAPAREEGLDRSGIRKGRKKTNR